MNNPEKFFKECQRILEDRSNVDCRLSNRRFLDELGKAWAAQLEIFLASQGIGLCQPTEPSKISNTVRLDFGLKDVSFPPIPGHLVATMFAVQKLFRGTLDSDKRDHAIDAVNYTWIALDERIPSAKQTS
jgi:hypothetical protein